MAQTSQSRYTNGHCTNTCSGHANDDLDEELSLLVKLLLIDKNHTGASVLRPEQLRVVPPQLIVLGDLSWRLRQVGALSLESTLVGRVVDPVGVAVVTDKFVGPLLFDAAGLGLRSRLDATNLLRLK